MELKCGNCDALQLEAAPDAVPVHFLTALITTPMPSLKSLNVFAAVLWDFDCWYVTLRRDLDFSPCDVTFDLEHL